MSQEIDENLEKKRPYREIVIKNLCIEKGDAR